MLRYAGIYQWFKVGKTPDFEWLINSQSRMYLENWTLKIISSIKYRSLWEPKGSNNEIGTIENKIFYCHEKQETSEAIAKAMEKQSIFITTGSERQHYVDQVTRIARLFYRLSCKERREDALALRADERRDKLRKAAVRSKYPLTRRCLNGETRLSKPQSPYTESIGIRREPGELKHLSSRRKRKKICRFPK